MSGRRDRGQAGWESAARHLHAVGHVESGGMAVEVRLQVDRETTARTAERLIFLPLFAPAAETPIHA